MITSLVFGALAAAAFLQQTDTLLPAQGATRLELENARGEVVVRTWDRAEVRVQARYPEPRGLPGGERESPVRIGRRGSTIEIDVGPRRGAGSMSPVDFELTVPRAFDLSLEGMALRADVQGTEGQVRVTTINGPIRVQGGRGTVVLSSVNGEISVEGAQGSLEAKGVASGVTLRNCSGDISVESVAGTLRLEGITSREVRAGTVSGSLSFQGGIEPGGRYTFGSHSGSITLTLPRGMDARVDAVTLAGRIEVDYPGAPSEPSRGEGPPGLRERRIRFVTGEGRARVEVETFAGSIQIRSGGEEP